MIIIPAIDLQNGKCVRLKQGDFKQSKIFSQTPVEQAKNFASYGIQRLHIVDLNGAKDGLPVHQKIIEDILMALPDVEIQIGGGIRDQNTANAYLNAGAKYIIVGTQAIQNIQFLLNLCDTHPHRVILSLDTHDEYIAIQGWQTTSNVTIESFMKKLNTNNTPLAAILHTDISKDGMMQGPSLTSTQKLAYMTSYPIIASGGVSNLKDVERLNELGCQNIEAVIVGRAIYEKTIDLSKAQPYLKQHAG